MIWSDSSAMSRTSVAIATTLVEFQEAQAWFIFAVQIASILAIVVNSQEGTFWGEIVVNAAVAYHISQNGILPMFLIQICLHNEGIRNWHTFVGFLLEYLLAIIAATQTIRWRDAFKLFQEQSNLPACGDNPSPRTYCAAIGSLDGMQISFFPHPVLYKMVFLVVDTVAIVVLVTDQLAWTLRKHRRTKHIRVGSYQAGRGPVGKYKHPWSLFKKWFWRVLEAVYVVINILYLVSLIMVIDAESFAANRWSYGQIIAVTVWGPVIVKLVDLLFCKFECHPSTTSSIRSVLTTFSWPSQERHNAQLGPAETEDRQCHQFKSGHRCRRRRGLQETRRGPAGGTGRTKSRVRQDRSCSRERAGEAGEGTRAEGC